MADIDRMPADRRALVHEFGYVIVANTQPQFKNVNKQRAFLQQWRANRQREWLSTDYIVPRKRWGASV
jgi:hypothetical protein